MAYNCEQTPFEIMRVKSQFAFETHIILNINNYTYIHFKGKNLKQIPCGYHSASLYRDVTKTDLITFTVKFLVEGISIG